MSTRTAYLTVLLTTVVFAGSAQAKPDEASNTQVQGCHFLSEVSGASGYGKNAGWKAIAKSRAEHKAGSIGATHIVWSSYRSVGAFNGEAIARAYDCRH